MNYQPRTALLPLLPICLSVTSFIAVALFDSHAKAQPSATPMQEYQPVAHARAAGANTCVGTLTALSRLTIDGNYAAMSNWNKSAPDAHMFNSVIGINHANATIPKAVSVLVTAPNAVHNCDATTVQVQPSALPCATLQNNMMQDKRNILRQLASLSIIDSNTAVRYLLLPGDAKNCVIVAVGNYTVQ